MNRSAGSATRADSAPSSSACCLNCGTPLTDLFCARCGQSAATARLSYAGLLRDGVRHFFVEGSSPLRRTVTGLFRNPGRVALEYVRGRRQHYTNPVKFLMLVVALSVLVLRLFFPDGLPMLAQSNEVFAQWGILESMQTITWYTTNYNQVTAIILLPVAALLLHLFFRSAGHNFSEQLAFTSYIYGLGELIKIPFMPLGPSRYGLLTTLFDFVLPMALLAWGAVTFNGVRKRTAVGRAIAVHLGFVMISAVFVYAAAFIMAYAL